MAASAPSTATGGGSALVSWLPIILIVIVFYFLLIRPQQRRQRDRTSLLKSLSPGDHVVTIGGLHGVVEQMDDSTVMLRTEGGIKLVFERSAVNSIREKGASVPEETSSPPS